MDLSSPDRDTVLTKCDGTPKLRHMSARLGAILRAERERRKLSLYTFATAYHEAGSDIHPSTLAMLETGKREGDPVTWSGLWRFLGLPWSELYREWGLPSPGGQGEDAEVVTIAQSIARLDSPRRQVVARFVDSLDYIVEPLKNVTNTIASNDEAGLNSALLQSEGVRRDGPGMGSATVRGASRLVAAHEALSRELSELSARSAGSADASSVAEGGGK
jgi:transcriptional regulator with XRE-family HTH domain